MTFQILAVIQEHDVMQKIYGPDAEFRCIECYNFLQERK